MNMSLLSDQKIFGKKLKEARKKAGFSQAEAAARLSAAGLPVKAGAVSTWETGNSLPNSAQFLTLCRLYHITDIYQQFVSPLTPSPEETTGSVSLDSAADGLNPEGLSKAADYIHLLQKSGEYPAESAVSSQRFRTIRLFTLPASAGTGEFLDSDDYQTVVIGEEVPDSADFGIRIHGDSMEPRFLNGQVVFVHRTEVLQNGEIGIFYLDGNAYCKEFRQNKKGIFLISLNRKYAPIAISENSDFRVFGKVVA